MNIKKTQSNKQPNPTLEEHQRNDRNRLSDYGVLTLPSCPKEKKNNKKKTLKPSEEDFER